MTYNSMCPSTPVMINWHQAGGITTVKEQWMIDSAVRLNPKLRLSPKHQPMALHAITKLDLSNNEIVSLPGEYFSPRLMLMLSLILSSHHSLYLEYAEFNDHQHGR